MLKLIFKGILFYTTCLLGLILACYIDYLTFLEFFALSGVVGILYLCCRASITEEEFKKFTLLNLLGNSEFES